MWLPGYPCFTAAFFYLLLRKSQGSRGWALGVSPTHLGLGTPAYAQAGSVWGACLSTQQEPAVCMRPVPRACACGLEVGVVLAWVPGCPESESECGEGGDLAPVLGLGCLCWVSFLGVCAVCVLHVSILEVVPNISKCRMGRSPVTGSLALGHQKLVVPQ